MKKQNGFTLIEILIALAVFAILATITSSTLYYAFTTRTRITAQADQLNNLQLALTLFERDITQTVQREVRGNNMHIFPVFVGEKFYLEFTRGGVINPNTNEKKSNLQRIAFLCKNKQLIKRKWYSLDTMDRTKFSDQVLLSHLNNCQFAYLNHSLQLLSEWRANAKTQDQKEEPLPKAIQFNLSLQNWGKASFLYIIPEALYAEK